MARQLTENQQNFLEVLFDQLDATRSYFARTAPRAAFALGNAVNDPTELGIKEKMVAAKDVLDRAGLIKTDKVDIQASSSVFYLPPKEGNNE